MKTIKCKRGLSFPSLDKILFNNYVTLKLPFLKHLPPALCSQLRKTCRTTKETGSGGFKGGREGHEDRPVSVRTTHHLGVTAGADTGFMLRAAHCKVIMLCTFAVTKIFKILATLKLLNQTHLNLTHCLAFTNNGVLHQIYWLDFTIHHR